MLARSLRPSLLRPGLLCPRAPSASVGFTPRPLALQLLHSPRALSTDSWVNHRAHVRPTTSDDKETLLAGRVFSDREWEVWYNFEKHYTWKQWFTARQLLVLMNVRNSFVHGGIRRALTFMAVYAAASEFLHDFFHHYHYIHYALSLLGTNHAVGFIALSHLSEHFKEYLEESDKPVYHEVERTRLDLMRIFQGTPHPSWPRHIIWYSDIWQACMRTAPEMDPIKLGIFTESDMAKWQAELVKAEKGGGGHH